MKSIQVKSHINANGILELCVPTGLPESDVEVVIVVQPIPGAGEKKSPKNLAGPRSFSSAL
jgi:hypothetical protein